MHWKDYVLKSLKIDTVYCEKLTLFDPKTPLICWKMAPSYGLCMISTTKQEWGLAWSGLLFIWISKRGGGGQVKGVREHSQAKLSKFGSYFGPILLSLVAPCCFLKVHRAVNFYFWTDLNVLQGFFQGRSLLQKLIRQ